MQPCRRVHISFELKKRITRKLQNSRQNDKVRVFTSLLSVSSLLRETRRIVFLRVDWNELLEPSS